MEQILDRTPGDVLVFLPGVGEIRQTARRLEPLAAARNLAVLPLYGDLPAEKQDEVLGPIGRRKVVLVDERGGNLAHHRRHHRGGR